MTAGLALGVFCCLLECSKIVVLQRFWPSNCSTLSPESTCFSGFRTTVDRGTFTLTSTGPNSCAKGSGLFFGEEQGLSLLPE